MLAPAYAPVTSHSQVLVQAVPELFHTKIVYSVHVCKATKGAITAIQHPCGSRTAPVQVS